MEIIFDPKCETKGKNNRILHLGLIPMLMKALESRETTVSIPLEANISILATN
jgi:hypothetical protein